MSGGAQITTAVGEALIAVIDEAMRCLAVDEADCANPAEQSDQPQGEGQ